MADIAQEDFINFSNCERCEILNTPVYELWDHLCGLVLATDPEVRVRFPTLPDFLRSSGSGTWSTQPLVNTTEELLGRKSSGSGLEIREYGRRDSSRWPRGTLYQQKLALISLTGGGRLVGIVRSRTQTTEFSSVYDLWYMHFNPIFNLSQVPRVFVTYRK
jgi:hypothetical protein